MPLEVQAFFSWRTLGLLLITSAWGALNSSTDGAEWGRDRDFALRQAAAERKPLVIRVGASWCGPCRQMHHLTWSDDDLDELLSQQTVKLYIDADEQPDVVQQFAVEKYPTLLVCNPDGAELLRGTGFMSAAYVREVLGRVGVVAQPSACGCDSELLSALEAENLPSGEFEGVCLVTLMDENRMIKGGELHAAEWAGKRVLFQSAEHRDRFHANPARYWPAGDGICPVSAVQGEPDEIGRPRRAVIYLGKLWFCSCREHQDLFMREPQRFVKVATGT